MDDPKTEDRSGEMEDDLHKLEDNIADAEKKLEGSKEAAGNTDDVAGEWEGEHDHHGGDDPVGATGEEADSDSDEPVDEELGNPT